MAKTPTTSSNEFISRHLPASTIGIRVRNAEWAKEQFLYNWRCSNAMITALASLAIGLGVYLMVAHGFDLQGKGAMYTLGGATFIATVFSAYLIALVVAKKHIQRRVVSFNDDLANIKAERTPLFKVIQEYVDNEQLSKNQLVEMLLCDKAKLLGAVGDLLENLKDGIKKQEQEVFNLFFHEKNFAKLDESQQVKLILKLLQHTSFTAAQRALIICRLDDAALRECILGAPPALYAAFVCSQPLFGRLIHFSPQTAIEFLEASPRNKTFLRSIPSAQKHALARMLNARFTKMQFTTATWPILKDLSYGYYDFEQAVYWRSFHLGFTVHLINGCYTADPRFLLSFRQRNPDFEPRYSDAFIKRSLNQTAAV